MTCSNSTSYVQEQWQNDYPERLWRENRSIDSNFDPNEKLYRRFPSHWFNREQNRVLPPAFSLPNCSVNREKYSQPQDVLLHRASCPTHNCLNWGVASFQVNDIPPHISSSEGNYNLGVVHDPCEYNYSHSEIRAYHHGQDNETTNIKNIIKKKFRTALSQKARAIIFPSS